MSRLALLALAIALATGCRTAAPPTCATLTCGDHATCSEATGTAACVCDPGFQDNDGDGTCKASCASSTCSAHGTCSDASGTTACTCDAEHVGASCETCAAGLQDNDHDGTCAAACTVSTCAGHGTCSDSSGAATCACDAAYSGATCTACATDFQDNDGDGTCAAACTVSTCAGHGTCSDSSGAATCACGAGYAGATCTACATDFQDNDGDGTCADACTASSCAGHGSCSDSSGATACSCDTGYAGSTCGTCDSGYQDNDHDTVCALACTPSTCGTHQDCADASGSAQCSCSAGWTGGTCNVCVEYASASGNPGADGASWATATTLSQALAHDSARIAAGESGCEVWVQAGTHLAYSTGATDTFLIPASVTVLGGFAGTESSSADRDVVAHPSILDGHDSGGSNQVRHVVTVGGDGVTLDGLTIQGGAALGTASSPAARGGGVYSISRSNLTLVGLTLRDNSALEWGGGLYVSGGSAVSITATLLESNSVVSGQGAGGGGGGAYLTGIVSGTLGGVTFDGNTTDWWGGGLLLDWAQPAFQISDLTFTHNRAGDIGGGLEIRTANASAYLPMNRVVAAYNSARAGAGLSTHATTVFYNCLVYGNAATETGGGLRLFADGAQVGGCTVVGNRAGTNADAIDSPKSTTVSGVILWNSGGSNVGNASFEYSVDQAGDFGANISTSDPKLASIPLDWARTTGAGTTTTVLPSSTSGFAVGDQIEVWGDGVMRTVSAVDATTVTFTPALGAASTSNSMVANWGPAPVNSAIDLHLTAGSSAIDAANLYYLSATDFDGSSRRDDPGTVDRGNGPNDADGNPIRYTDIGAFEY